MWGPWFFLIFGGVLGMLLLVALAFGTSPAVFAFLIAWAIVFAIGFGYGLMRASARKPDEPGASARRGGEPASGEGSTPPASGPSQASPAVK